MSQPDAIDICYDCDVVVEGHAIIVNGDLTCPYCGEIIQEDVE